MKKKLFYIVIASVLMITGCNSDDTDMIFLDIIKADVEFTAAGGSGTITISSSIAVSAQSNKSWLTIIEQDITMSSIPFVLAENSTISARTATITISEGSNSKEVNITQEGSIFFISDEVIMPPAATTYDVEYASNAGAIPVVVVPTEYRSWLSASVLNGKLIVATLSDNIIERSATIKLVSAWKNQEVKIIQKGIVDRTLATIFNGDVNPYNVIILDKEVEDKGYSISADKTWIKYSVDNGVLTIYSDTQNDTGSLRSGSLSITSNDVTATIEVAQYHDTLYKYLSGSWKMNHNLSSTNVTFEEYTGTHNNAVMIVKGLAYEFGVGFDASTGKIVIVSQQVASGGDGSLMYLCPYNTAASRVTIVDGAGFNISFNGDFLNPSLTLQDNGVWRNYVADGFGFCVYDPYGTYLGYRTLYFYVKSFTK